MLGTSQQRLPLKSVGTCVQQVRHLKRTPAYPVYRAPIAPKTHPKKDHSSTLARQLKAWLGPRNVRGEYFRNKYYYPPQNHTPNYVVVDGESVAGAQGGDTRFKRVMGPPNRDPSVHPFPQNTATRTASIIPDTLKDTIYQRVVENGELPQVIANDYKIKMPRVEAIVALAKIEKQHREQELINKDMDKFARVMYRMFPLYTPQRHAENLTEIPTPHKTLQQRFLTISESEPFGPVDAASIFGLEPAGETLRNITQHNTAEEQQQRAHRVVIGEQKQNDKAVFKFIQSKSGDVGFRYGASRRDRKKDRAVSFDKEGRMVYTPF